MRVRLGLLGPALHVAPVQHQQPTGDHLRDTWRHARGFAAAATAAAAAFDRGLNADARMRSHEDMNLDFLNTFWESWFPISQSCSTILLQLFACFC